jgi:tetratricopeptide (TPR) repeat protein/predicted Ser/Thr protein kinase
METIARFELRRVLGRGGAATVYEARDGGRGGRVALKLVAEKLNPSPARRSRFLREAQLASDLAHPNLVHVVEAGEHRGRAFVAMELVEGVDLERVIRSGRPFPVEWTIDVLRQVCEGLHRAHLSGLVHGDLKPTDIRVNSEGVVKILDFGVAALKAEGRGDEPPLLSGIHYRAPELIEGRKPDARSDIFSVGAIFYELLASQKPFPADTITGVMFRIRHENADPASLPATGFSPGLEGIVLRALRRSPAERYASFEELRDELAALVREAAPRLVKREDGESPAETEGPAPDAAAPPPEGAGLHAALDRARERGESEMALAIVRRLLDIDPDDLRARQVAEEVEAEGREREAEQLCAIALAYAADGEVDLAAEITEKIERLSPWSPRYLQLQVYLDEEAARRDSEAHAAAARASFQAGDLAAAVVQAEQALAIFPTHRAALEVREQALARLPPPRKDEADDRLADDLEAAVRQETRVPSGQSRAADLEGSGSQPATALPPAPDDSSRHPVRAVSPEAVSPGSDPPSRKTDVELLTTAALDRFLKDDHAGARRAASMALELDPQNRKARELLKVLGVLP